MRYLLISCLFIITACTSFNMNESGIRKACRGGVKEYDDGSTNFKCFEKDQEDKKDATEKLK